MIKLIAVDLDGTLLLDDHITVPEENRKALKQAHDQGIQVMIATGRTLALARGVISQLDFLRYSIISNGAVIVDLPANRRIYTDEIPGDTGFEILRLIHTCLPPEASYQFYIDGAAYMQKDRFQEFRRSIGIASFADTLLQTITLVEDPLDFCKGKPPLEKLNIDSIEKENRQALLKGLQALGSFTITSSFAGNMEINALHTTKGKALIQFCQDLGIASSEVLVFGDSSNDDTMLQFADYSYAMANGEPQTKSKAKYQAPKNTDCGVAQIIQSYLKK